MAANGWTCKFCTYPENDEEYLTCIMCNMPRHATEQEKCPVCFTVAEIPEDQVGGFMCPICDTIFQAKFPHKAVKTRSAAPVAVAAAPSAPQPAAASPTKLAVVISGPDVSSCPICFSQITMAGQYKCPTCEYQDLELLAAASAAPAPRPASASAPRPASVSFAEEKIVKFTLDPNLNVAASTLTFPYVKRTVLEWKKQIVSKLNDKHITGLNATECLLLNAEKKPFADTDQPTSAELHSALFRKPGPFPEDKPPEQKPHNEPKEHKAERKDDKIIHVAEKTEGGATCSMCFAPVSRLGGWVCTTCGHDNAPEKGDEPSGALGPGDELIVEHEAAPKDSSDDEDEKKAPAEARAPERDGTVSPKCPVCFTVNNVLFSQQNNIQCIICDNFFTGTEEAPAQNVALPQHDIVKKTITKVKGAAAITRFAAITAMHNSFVFTCPTCFSVMQVPRAQKDNFKCAVCGHECSIKMREQKRKVIHTRAANAKKQPNYLTIKKRGGEDEWKKRADRITEEEALLYSPFAREMNLARDVPKKCDCLQHEEYHAPLIPDHVEKKPRKITVGLGRRKSDGPESPRRITSGGQPPARVVSGPPARRGSDSVSHGSDSERDDDRPDSPRRGSGPFRRGSDIKRRGSDIKRLASHSPSRGDDSGNDDDDRKRSENKGDLHRRRNSHDKALLEPARHARLDVPDLEGKRSSVSAQPDRRGSLKGNDKRSSVNARPDKKRRGSQKKDKKHKRMETQTPKEERLYSVCLTCQERMCEKCENVVHSHPERAGHVRISFDLFQRCKALYLKMDDIGELEDGKLSCARLQQVANQFFPKAAARKVEAGMRANVESFGSRYELDFRGFLAELAPRLPLQGPIEHEKESYLQRMDTDQLITSHAQEYKKLPRWTKLMEKPKAWLKGTLFGYFSLWGSSIRKVEASHGAHIASYFYFSRWLFFLNLVVAVLYASVLIIPWAGMGKEVITSPFNWWGIIVGYGLEGSVMFYGDYKFLAKGYVPILVPSNDSVLATGTVDFAQPHATFRSWGAQSCCRVDAFTLNDNTTGCGSDIGCSYQIVTGANTIFECQDACRVSWCTGVSYQTGGPFPECQLWRVWPGAVTSPPLGMTSECHSKVYTDIGVTDEYPLDTAWIIMYGVMMIVTILGIIQHMGAGRGGNLKEDPQFAFSTMLFTGIDFNVTHKHSMALLRMNAVTSFDELLKYKADEKLKLEANKKGHDEEADKNAWKVFAGMMTCLALASMNWLGFYYMFIWERYVLLVGVSDSRRVFLLMVCPLIVSITKAILPKVFNEIIHLEEHTRSGPIFRHYFARVFILEMSYIVFFLILAVYRPEDTLRSQGGCLESENGILFYRILVAEIVVEAVAVLLYPASRMQLRRIGAKIVTYRVGKAAKDKLDRMSDRLSFHWGKHMPKNQLMKRQEGGELDKDDVGAVADDVDKLQEDLQTQRLQHQKSRSVIDQSFLEDPTKMAFNLTDNIVAAIYLQTLIFCGLLYCPMLPIVGIVFHSLLFYTKLLQIHWFTKRSKRPMSVARQNRFFRMGMVLSLLITILPFTTFLRSRPECGPGLSEYSSVAESFTATVNSWPSAVVVVVSYLSNQMLLWMLLVCLIIWATALHSRSKSINKEIKATSMRLKMETFERKKIIKEYGVSLGYDEIRGRDMFTAFVAELGELGTKYVAPLKEYGFGDLVRICKLSREQISGLLVRGRATQEEIEIILAKVDEKRHELI